MLVFPQLTSGGNAQYPLVRSVADRTVANVLQDGTAVKFEDVSAGRTRWTLSFESLNDTERLAIQQLFLAAEGELNTFTLLDPASNLLAWSEDLTKPVWIADPLIQATAGVADPFGGTRAWTLTNAGQATQKIAQSIAGPAGFEYCFSVYVRGTGSVSLLRGTSDIRTVSLTSRWERASTAGRLSVTADTFQVAIALDPGASVQVFGPQLEAQPAAGPYRRSLGVQGVASVRFESDQLTTAGVGLDRNRSIIRLVSVE